MTPIKPVNVSHITAAVQEMFVKAVEMEQATVERSSEVNELPTLCPWIGIYRGGVEYPIRTLGLGAGFRGQRVSLVVMVQQADATSGEECEERLEQLIVDAISVLLSDPTLGGTVDTIDEFTVQYVDYMQTADSGYMQTAGIYFTAITSVR